MLPNLSELTQNNATIAASRWRTSRHYAYVIDGSDQRIGRFQFTVVNTGTYYPWTNTFAIEDEAYKSLQLHLKRYLTGVYSMSSADYVLCKPADAGVAEVVLAIQGMPEQSGGTRVAVNESMLKQYLTDCAASKKHAVFYLSDSEGLTDRLSGEDIVKQHAERLKKNGADGMFYDH